MKGRRAIRLEAALRRTGRGLALLALAAWLLAGPALVAPALFSARAALPTCSVHVFPINFGTVNLADNMPINATGQAQVHCEGGEANRTVYACINFGEGVPASGTGSPRRMSNGAAQIVYDLYTNSSHTTVWGSNEWAFAPGGVRFANPLGPSGTNTLFNLPVYARIPAGQQAAPTGLYTGVFSGGHLVLRYSYTDSADCKSGESAIAAGDVTVTADNQSSCTISASNMVFPNAATLSTDTDAVSTVTATCSGGKPYTIGLGLGLGAGVVDPAARRMTGGGGTIVYGLYRDAARSQPWGSDAPELYSGTGNGNAQAITVYGRVPAQTTPSFGTYSDTIVATITY